MNKEIFEKEIDKLDLSEPTGYNEYGFFSLKLPKESIKVLEELGNREKLQEQIIRRYLTTKFSTIEIEVEELSKTAVLYEAHLIQMKDLLSSISSKYDEQLSDLEDRIIEKHIQIREKVLDPLKEEAKELEIILKGIEDKVSNMDKRISATLEKVKSIPSHYTLTEVTRLAGEWDRLSAESKKLIAPLFSFSESKK